MLSREEQNDVLEGAARLLEDVGWVQGHFAVVRKKNGELAPTLSSDELACAFCIAGAIMRSLRDNGFVGVHLEDLVLLDESGNRIEINQITHYNDKVLRSAEEAAAFLRKLKR